MRRLSVVARPTGLLLVAASLLLPLLGGAAGAQDEPSPPLPGTDGVVRVVEISGLLDDILADFLEGAVRDANDAGAVALVLQVNSRQAVVSDERLNELADLIDDSPLYVAAWVGPSGSVATGKTAQLLAVADRVVVNVGSDIGDTGPQVLDPDRYGVLWGDNAPLLRDSTVNWEQAIDLGISTCVDVELDPALIPEGVDPAQAQRERCAATIVDFILDIPGVESREVLVDGQPRREPITSVQFGAVSLIDQLFHTVASAPVAYLMFIIGMALILFEFFSAGVGIAGVIGAIFMLLGTYGLAVLPHRTWAIVALVLAMLAFATDIQTAVPRVWTMVGTVLFAVGTVFLFPDAKASMSWIPMVVGILGMAVVMWRGMPIMVRGRFATTVIPRDFLEGREATVVSDGVVSIDETPWPASLPSSVAPGQKVQVIGSNGPILECGPVR